VIFTTSFYDKVLNSGFDIDEDYFKTVEKKRRKQWDKMINAQVLRGAGMLEVTVYHENKVQAENLSKAITQVMSTSAWEYVGSRNIQVKEVDTPLVSTWPVRPNFLLNGLLSAILGVILSTIYVLAGQKKFVLDILNLEESDIGAHDIHGYAPEDDSIKDAYSKEDVDAFFAEADEIEYEKPAGKQAGQDYHYFQNM
jgi:capsular polysaccharide biosynthesis protein